MRRILIAICGAIVVLSGCQPQTVEPIPPGPPSMPAPPPAPAPTPAPPPEVSTEAKQAALEQNAAAAGDKSPPSVDERIDKVEAQAVDPLGNEPMDDAITCLARTIYWEARGIAEVGMEGVANVVMNRLGHSGFPNTVCGVVKQGREQSPCQFSWWCDGRPDQAKDDESYTIAKEIARKALNLQLPDRTDGALYFHHGDVSPAWSKEFFKTVEISPFVFYKPKGDDAR